MTLASTARLQPDSPYAWRRLVYALVIMTIGSCGMYVIPVALPYVQAEFAVDRGAVSLSYSMTMLGFAFGGIVMGRLADRYGVVVPLVVGALMVGAGFALAAMAPSLWLYSLIHALLIGVGSSASFAPMVADISHWFDRRRGIAVALCASGNYLAGAVWPPIHQHFFESAGWRATYVGTGLVCVVGMLALAFLFRHRPSTHTQAAAASASVVRLDALGISPRALMALLAVAGVGCCVAMSMPQVHIVAYCMDLGYGAARGAEMLSVMLLAGIVSRIVSGWISDRIGGLRTLLLGSVLQGVALVLFLPFDGIVSLYVVSALFGLFQGGIVPAYALIIREYFPPSEAGSRVGIIIMATLFGMAFGGWLPGVIFDLTGSYRAAFLNGIAWNLLNLVIVVWLLRRSRPPAVLAAA